MRLTSDEACTGLGPHSSPGSHVGFSASFFREWPAYWDLLGNLQERREMLATNSLGCDGACLVDFLCSGLLYLCTWQDYNSKNCQQKGPVVLLGILQLEQVFFFKVMLWHRHRCSPSSFPLFTSLLLITIFNDRNIVPAWLISAILRNSESIYLFSRLIYGHNRKPCVKFIKPA